MPGAIGQDQRQRRVRLGQLDRHLMRARHLDRGDGDEVRLDVGALILLAAIEVELDRLGIERRAVVKHDVLAQVEHERQRVGELPAFGQPRPRLQRLVLPFDQRIEDDVEEGMIEPGAAGVRIEARRIGGRRDLQHAAALRRLCRRRDRAQGIGCSSAAEQPKKSSAAHHQLENSRAPVVLQAHGVPPAEPILLFGPGQGSAAVKSCLSGLRMQQVRGAARVCCAAASGPRRTGPENPREREMTRLPMIAEDKLTDAQKNAVKAVTAGQARGRARAVSGAAAQPRPVRACGGAGRVLPLRLVAAAAAVGDGDPDHRLQLARPVRMVRACAAGAEGRPCRTRSSRPFGSASGRPA